MRLTPILLVLLGTLPSLSSAQELSPSLPVAIDLALSEMGAAEVTQADLNLDGTEEALLVQSGDCGGEGCGWRLIGSDPAGSGWGVMAGGVAARTELVETWPEGHVIRTDGIILSWDGVELSPYHDLLSMTTHRVMTPSESRRLSRLIKDRVLPIRYQAYDIQPFLDGRSWTLFLSADVATEGLELPSPFYLISPDHELSLQGRSLGRPWLYQDQAGSDIVLRVVSITPDGLLMETLHD